MFDLSLGEILLVVVVAAVFIGPKEMPVVIRSIARLMKSVRALAAEVRGAFDELAKESGVKDAAEDINKNIRLIEGDDGQMYESYDMPVNPTKKSHGI
ncbi:MAG: twin-arginine translocase TatA/TatE family subunit [Alphaproteobacteria bacterium]